VGHIREQRSIRLFEETLLSWLEDGVIPTSEQLQEAYSLAESKHGDLVKSSLNGAVLPQRWAESSASQHNEVINLLGNDLDVLLRSLTAITDLGITTLGEWSARSKSLETRVERLKLRIESLILLKSDSAGFVSFVEDGFFSLEKVNQETTANIDTRTGEVTLNIDRSEASGSSQGTQIDLLSSQVSWAIIESSNVRFSSKTAGSNLNNLFSDKNNRWGVEIETSTPDQFKSSNKATKSIVGELKLKLSKETEISKIVLLPSDSTAGTSSVIAAQFSTDGYVWANVPSESPVQSGTGNFIWRFPLTKVLWIKFIVSKAAPDITGTTENIYDFGFDRLKVYSEEFIVTEGGDTLVSEPLVPILADKDVLFGRASLEVCEEVPEGTSLRYYLKAYDGIVSTDWIQISPLSREENSNPAVIDFTAPNSLSSEDLLTIFNPAINVESLNVMRLNGTNPLNYAFDSGFDTSCNFYIDVSDEKLSDLVLLRNTGYSTGKFPAISQDLKVGDIECGWGLESDSLYYCTFLIKNPDGLIFDFGRSQAVIDGRVVSGIVQVNSGYHEFKTDRANWGTLSGSSITSLNELKARDPLYPYNHKYMIEGFNYPTTWNGEKIYLGVDEYCQYRSRHIGKYDFSRTAIDLSIYALDVISGSNTIVLLKFDSSRPNHENERVRFFYTKRFEAFDKIQIKAVLQGLSDKTPIITYYRVRVK